ncbi:4,5:9,10-diseco-3-hydroxy-5,9,17-trioxoandrosta-1(10),2-diene-4-oate hydrolase-like [Juglans microcarpa x Juglans regia]|uniref:4,5:9,10-diseco-3-hydroxy-5,9, 17-trioxoandrosta-1(10),2-diene-4-oate hydrolase-like n=1 Tax=Juglans microcarpa x Juglans regia TaxID=2249226 RepID=UPI001B7DD9BC|nr:4,5:9,10-diseco-3-hydroxy-5,9,17-trioxoandrosta-1(10),2-diene-4-oate hydrolase-like [Juglans microcarpa x Juglans regia]
MLPQLLSPAYLYGGYLRRAFTSSGLSSQTIGIDSETTIHFWGPRTPKTDQTQNSTGQKPSLVLIHGFGPMALWQWRQQVQFFSHHFDVYVPDLVFFGGSTTRSSERSEIFQAVSVGKLLERLGVQRFYVVGTSYGGIVAYHMARIWPEKVEKVVIASSGVNMRRRDNEGLLKRANLEKIEELMLPATAEQLRTLLSLSVSKRFHLLPDFFLNDFLHKLYSQNRKEKMELLKGLTLGRDDKANISPLLQEVLIVWGDCDKIFPLEMATELKVLLGGKTRLEVIKNTSHVPQIECPGQFNNVIRCFLTGSS